MRVKAILFASSIVVVGLLAGAGCSKKDPASGSSASSGTTGGSAAKPPPPPAPTVQIYEPGSDVPGPLRGAISEEDRSDKDRVLDAGRKPGEVLGFFKVAPGQRIGELFAGGGYTTEILARTLGTSGKIYAQNTKEVMDKFARAPMTERLAKPQLANTTLLETPADAPFTPEAQNLDVVICNLNYHDYVWQKVDRTKLNAAVFAALKPGGVYGIVDHSAAKGSGVRDVETLHRIDEEIVKQEVTAAGFKLDAESEVLRNPADPRDWNASPTKAADKRGTSDRFVLRFVKP
jgi:predicted methyltransferase